MNYTFYDFLTLIGSLGLFLYGMKVMSEGLQKMAGERLRVVLAAMTKNRVMGVLTGMMVTTLIQSSSATTVMVVSFVSAGLLSLVQAITVIMGANIGTTVTAWIISLFGFKFSISIISLPLIGFSMPFLFSKNNNRKSIGEFMIGFAFLFMGLDFLKNAVPDLKGNPQILSFLADYTNMGFPSILLFLLIGTLLTIIVQSSSATMAITLIMCSKGWISFEIAAAMVLGENIGTTITANLAAMTANISAKRAAFAHFIFNVFGVIWVLALFSPFIIFIKWILAQMGANDPGSLMNLLNNMTPVTEQLISGNKPLADPNLEALRAQYIDGQVAVSFALSLFHTVFNIINVLIMIWFVNLYVKVVTWVIKNKNTEEEFRLHYISTGLLSTAELSILEAHNEIVAFVKRTRKMFDLVGELSKMENDDENFKKLYEQIEKNENICDRMEIEIANYLNKVAEGQLSPSSNMQVKRKMVAISEIESIADSCFHITRTIHHKIKNQVIFTDELNQNMEKMFSKIDEMLFQLESLFLSSFTSDVNEIFRMEEEINQLRKELRRENAIKVNEKVYDYQAGIHYMDIINSCETLADYVVNVTEAMSTKMELKPNK